LGGGFPFVDFSNFGNIGGQTFPSNTGTFPQMMPQGTHSTTNFFETTPSVDSSMKQIFRNNEITVYASLTKSFDKTNVSGAFYISNNVDRLLNNVKMNLSVKKHVNCKVLSTSGAALEPNKSLGIKKVKYIFLFYFF
jgi:hypothetical protein